MEAKAFQCMQMGLNVLFILPSANGKETKTLLALKIQEHWKNLKEQHQWQNDFHFCSLRRKGIYIDFVHLKELIQSEAYRDAAVFVDELSTWNNNDLQDLIEIVAMYQQRTIWIAITSIDHMQHNEVSTEKVKMDFEKHNFYIPELLNPIRNSKEIVKFAHPSIKGKVT